MYVLKGSIGFSHIQTVQQKILYIRSLYVEVHYVTLEYENEKAKPSHCLIQLVDLDDPNDQ